MERKVILIVLDSVGIGASADAHMYGDEGSDTLGHIAEYMGGLYLPFLESLGLGNIRKLIKKPPLCGVNSVLKPEGLWGAGVGVSKGKDTLIGHWEIAGVYLKDGFRVFPKGPPSFPSELIYEFERQTGRGVIGNKAASGTEIINELGQEHEKTGKWIVYTSADSVFQIAAHEDIVPVDELYNACKIARKLSDKYMIGRVIARPFKGIYGSYFRTRNRRDYVMEPPCLTLLDILVKNGIPVFTVGKLDDIFAHRGISKSIHVESTLEAKDALLGIIHENFHGFVFVNFIDFDMLYGHRRDVYGYAKALEEIDVYLAELSKLLKDDDVLVITSDHGNDPTFHGTDHTREYVPIIFYSRSLRSRCIGIRYGLYDIGQSIARLFGVSIINGKSFI